MARFHPLKVIDVRRETRDAVVVTLEPRDEDRALFGFTQGQYLTFRRNFDGEELRRSYSICAGVDEGCLKVGIKRVEGGAFSTWANAELRPGDVLEAMPPMGNFHAPIDPAAEKHYLLFAGGSGITPVLGILKTILAEEPGSSATLVYGNRSTSSIMFREELEDLKNENLGRLSILHVLESEAQDIELFSGRVDREKCDALFSAWIDVASADMAFICGPEPMMLAIADALKAHGMPEARIKFELFLSSQPGRARRTAAASALAADYLAREDARHLLVVGTGRLSRNLAAAHASVRPLSRVSVWGRDPEKAQAVADEIAEELDILAQPASDLEATVRDADIVSCATLSETPLVQGAWLKPGSHLDLVGAFKPTMRESDDEAVSRARVFVDTREGAMKEGGDIVRALASGALEEDGIEADLFDLARGTHAVLRQSDDITLFKSVGAALEDLAGAILAFETASAKTGQSTSPRILPVM